MLQIVKDRKHGEVSLEFISISPTTAAAMLDKNSKNRNPKKRFLDQFARDMVTGSWKLTGDPIKFDKEGNLIDGQHRLMACVQAQKPFETFVAYGLDAETRDVVDTGAPRSNRDVLTMHGIHNASHVASTVRLLIAEKIGEKSQTAVTHSETLACLAKHPSLPTWVQSAHSFPKGISVPLVSYVAYVGATLINKKPRVLAMLEVLQSGVPDYEGDPIQKYREKVIRARQEGVGSIRGSRRSPLWTFKHCWNLFAKKEQLDRVHWHKDNVDIKGLNLEDL